MKTRILVAVVGVPILLYIVLCAPEWVLAAALAVLAGIGGLELYHCACGKGGEWEPVLSFLIPALTVVCYYIGDYTGIWFILLVLAVFGGAVVEGGRVSFLQIMTMLFGGIAIAYAFSSFLRICALGVSRGYLLLPFILSFACDTFAYFTGLAFGKHKLAPKVSPKKTVEGSVGGLVGNVICGLLFAWVMNRWFGGNISYWPMAVLSLFCGVVAQIGDLSFSLIKREFGIKDYGKIFLAHGGAGPV